MSQSLIQQSLILDHLFFAATEDEFSELKDLFLLLECTDHQNVKTDDDAWEGLYIHTRGQFYLEVLKMRRPNCIGLCQKPRNPLYFDAREIATELPSLPWKSFERSLKGQKWFTALSCDNYLDLTTPFNTWVMHYHQMNRKAAVTFKKFEIETIFDFEVEADPDLAERIRQNSSWFNGTKTETKDRMDFALQTYYSEPLRLTIHLQAGRNGLRFRKLKLRFVKDFDPSVLSSVHLRHFKFTKIADYYQLEYMTP